MAACAANARCSRCLCRSVNAAGISGIDVEAWHDAIGCTTVASLTHTVAMAIMHFWFDLRQVCDLETVVLGLPG
jgi:hypothetical protein